MNPFIKAAMDLGKAQAEADVKAQLKTELQKRQTVGWKEQAQTPKRLSEPQK